MCEEFAETVREPNFGQNSLTEEGVRQHGGISVQCSTSLFCSLLAILHFSHQSLSPSEKTILSYT